MSVQKIETPPVSKLTDTSCDEISELDLEEEIRDILETDEAREIEEAEKKIKTILPNAIIVTPSKPQKLLNSDGLHPSRERSYSWDNADLIKLFRPNSRSAFTSLKKK